MCNHRCAAGSNVVRPSRAVRLGASLAAFLSLWALPDALPAQAEAAESPWHVVPGLHVGTPATVSIAVAIARTLDRQPDAWRDLFVALEPGLAAGRVSAGYAHFAGNLATGFTVRGTALRRWKTSVTYVGVEGSLHALFLGPRVGVFVPVSGDDTGRVMLSIDLAFGY